MEEEGEETEEDGEEEEEEEEEEEDENEEDVYLSPSIHQLRGVVTANRRWRFPSPASCPSAA